MQQKLRKYEEMVKLASKANDELSERAEKSEKEAELLKQENERLKKENSLLTALNDEEKQQKKDAQEKLKLQE